MRFNATMMLSNWFDFFSFWQQNHHYNGKYNIRSRAMRCEYFNNFATIFVVVAQLKWSTHQLHQIRILRIKTCPFAWMLHAWIVPTTPEIMIFFLFISFSYQYIVIGCCWVCVCFFFFFFSNLYKIQQTL